MRAFDENATGPRTVNQTSQKKGDAEEPTAQLAVLIDADNAQAAVINGWYPTDQLTNAPQLGRHRSTSLLGKRAGNLLKKFGSIRLENPDQLGNCSRVLVERADRRQVDPEISSVLSFCLGEAHLPAVGDHTLHGCVCGGASVTRHQAARLEARRDNAAVALSRPAKFHDTCAVSRWASCLI